MKRAGFTLIELLVVITVIAILASIAYPVYTGVQERAKIAQDLNNLRQIGLATQMYLNDNDGTIFSTSDSWMNQLKAKYLPAWKIFQSPFDKRAAAENGTSSPVSYGINGNSIVGTLDDKITNPTVFVLFAAAPSSGASVSFQGVGSTAAPGVTVLGQGGNTATSSPGGNPSAGTHNNRTRINACMADLHVENMLWGTFTNNVNNPSSSSDPCGGQRWNPAATCP
jgi:prepilin-type N-terminal cleavage/methylation domain-containing protein/prepilin-type processing-associated H-X9-DG protein